MTEHPERHRWLITTLKDGVYETRELGVHPADWLYQFMDHVLIFAMELPPGVENPGHRKQEM